MIGTVVPLSFHRTPEFDGAYPKYGGRIWTSADIGLEDRGKDWKYGKGKTTWSGLGTKLKKLWPFLWPRKHPGLQCRVVFCFFLLFAGRAVNPFVPVYYKKIVNSLSGAAMRNEVLPPGVKEKPPILRWDYVLIFIGLRFLQGGGFATQDFLTNLRKLLWIRVQQYTAREMGCHLLGHLHSLSMKWHLTKRKTGAIIRIMERGTKSITTLLSVFLFNIAPIIVDTVIAIVYFVTAFNLWLALVVLVTLLLYLIFTVGMAEWRAKFRREKNIRDNERQAVGVDSLLNFETVKTLATEDFEKNRYHESISRFQEMQWITNASLVMMDTGQGAVLCGGLLAGSMLSAWLVTEGTLTVGDFVLFGTYANQLYGPISSLAALYKQLQNAFVDMENLFELLDITPEIQDIQDAAEFQFIKGAIEFKNVSFHYESKRPILKGVSFIIEPGKTIALVGPSGSGKSTIVKLIMRYYDVTGGTITIDDQDVSQVTQHSLRKALSVVPQDTVLFNNTIRYNVRYGRARASDEEISDAAHAADIHERIMAFPKGYDTAVGERGLKLSGGERQRIAIARTILQSPKVLALDEATSALDVKTEHTILLNLAKMCQNSRITTLVVTHRLTTITHVDEIIVLKYGQIAERGKHEELLAANGVYADMWQKQLQEAQEALKEGHKNNDIRL